jgi:hypothetical protein
MDVHRPILAVLEGSKAIEDQRLIGRLIGKVLLMKEKTVSAEAVGQASNRGVGDASLARDLAKSRAGNQAMEDGLEEVASAEPVVGGEGL